MKTSAAAPDPKHMDPQLAAHLHTVAARLRATRLHRLGMWRWLGVAGLTLGLLQLRAAHDEFTSFTAGALALLFVAAVLAEFLVRRRTPYDYTAAARLVENEFPDLRLALHTAAEQKPAEAGGRFNFLQRRVIDDTLRHARRNPWTLRSERQSRWMLSAHTAVAVGAFALASLVLHRGPVILPWSMPGMHIEVTPGDQEIERGSNVVVAARFSKKFSRVVDLVWQSTDGKSHRAPMVRPLNDPVYTFTLPRVGGDVTYFVAHDDGQTDQFKLSVFDQPALVRPDATLNYPKFTGLPDKTILNTRRVSAVTGTKLQYDFTVNKPLASATLTDETGAEIKLTPSNPEHTRFTTNFTIEATHTYALHLTDEKQRVNPAPTSINVTAVEHKPAQVALVFPRGDSRVSPIEEMNLQASAKDDYGLLDYGIAISIGSQAPQYISLKPPATAAAAAPVTAVAPPAPAAAATPASPPASGTPPKVVFTPPANGATAAAVATPAAPSVATVKPALSAKFGQQVPLETKGVQADDLVTWFAWADAAGDDNQPRRVTSDLAFAEVRPFEEAYRQASAAQSQALQQQQQQQQQNGQQPQDNPLLDLQQKISVAIFKLSQQTAPGKDYATDVKTLQDEQAQAMTLLQDAQANLTNARQQAAADQAKGFMQQSADNLAAAADKNSLQPLNPAWTGAQGAYQALLRLQARNFNIAQTQRGQGQPQQQPRNRNQQQLDQLDMRQQQDQAYQDQTQAQAPMTAEQRQQLQVQSRLNDLSRRQTDVNQRLQELQTALKAAQNEQQKQDITRELKRLEDEQNNMLAQLDEARQNANNLPATDQNQQARQQLDQAREDMRRAGDQLAQGNVQQALAAGTRTQQQLDDTRQSLQRDSSSQFAEQMRTARQQARDLATSQQQIEQQLAQNRATGASQLDDTAQRDALAQNLDQQRTNLTNLMNNLQQVTADSEATEPTLHRQLYNLLRDQTENQAQANNSLQAASQLLRQGLVDQSREAQTGVAKDLDQLRQGVEKAADSVLGDETQTLQFAQSELGDLARQLQQDRANAKGGDQAAPAPAAATPGGQPAGPQLAQNGVPGATLGADSNPDGSGQNAPGQPGQNGAQRGQRAGQGGQPGDVAQNGDGQQPGNQPGGAGQQPGGTSEDFRTPAQPAGEGGNLAQSGAGQRQGAAGPRGQGGQPGQRGSQGRGDANSGDFAQGADQAGNGPGGQRGQGGQPGQRAGGGQRGQGQGGQPGDLAQNDAAGQGQRSGAGQRGGQGQGRGQGQGQGGQPGDLAQNDANGGTQGQGDGQGQRGGGTGQRGGAGQRGGQGRGGQGQGDGDQPQLAQSSDQQGGQGQGQGQGRGQGQGQGQGQGRGQGPGRGQGQGGGGQGGQLAQNGGRAGGGGGGVGGGGGAGGPVGALDGIAQLAQELNNGGPQSGPLTGEDFATWADRLRTVEQLVDDPNLRQQLNNARTQAEDMRRTFQTHTVAPRWNEVQNKILTPLISVQAQLRAQLARAEQPDTLQPADRDPVPEKYADSVRSYYELLGSK